GGLIGLVARNAIVSNRMRTAEVRAAKLVSDAELEAETKVRTSLLEVKEEISGMRRASEEDLRIRREEIQRNEERLARREQATEERMTQVADREKELQRIGLSLTTLKAQLEQAGEEHRRELERVSRMTVQEAK